MARRAKPKAADGSDRQLNLGFGKGSKLRRDLARACSETGMARSKVVRGVLEQFLPIWRAQQTRQRAEAKRLLNRIRSEPEFPEG